MFFSRTLTALLDALYPSQCGICGALPAESLCPVCRAQMNDAPQVCQVFPDRSPLISVVAPLFYTEGTMEAIRRFKFDRATCLAQPLRELLSNSLSPHFSRTDIDLVIPVPIHWSRQSSRGFNQSELLCDPDWVWPVRPQLLRRIKRTRPQVGLNFEARQTNLQGAFRASKAVHGARILLIDDVYTSGGTAAECARTLKSQGAREVHIACVARTPIPS